MQERIACKSKQRHATTTSQVQNVVPDLHADSPPTFDEIGHHIEAHLTENDNGMFQAYTKALQNVLQNYRFLIALSNAPLESTNTKFISFLVAGDAFFQDNPLVSASINESTQIKYVSALENFRSSEVATIPHPITFDKGLSVYIQERFFQDSCPWQTQEMSNLVCMLLIMHPCLRDELRMSRRCLSGWKHLKPSTSASPLTHQVGFAFKWKMLQQRQVHAAAALLVSFSACLCVSEALKFTWKDNAFPGDVRVSFQGPGTAIINIHDAKTSRKTDKLQFVALKSREVIIFLQMLEPSSCLRDRVAGKLAYPHYLKVMKSISKH